jgi:hypothetical protein
MARDAAYTAMDVFEQLVPADLRQAAVVVATVLYRRAYVKPSADVPETRDNDNWQTL